MRKLPLAILTSWLLLGVVTLTASTTVDLTSYWKLDDASSANAADADGSNTLTDVNGVASAAGKVGTSRLFVSANAEALSSTTPPATSLPLSVSLWLRPDDVTVTSANIFSVGIDGTNNFAWGITINGSSKVEFYASDGSASFDMMTGTTTLVVDTWYHIVVVWRTDTDRELYVNAVSEKTDATSRSPSASADRFRLGSYKTAGDYLDGSIDEVGVWSQALDTTEISELYNSGNGLAYESFDSGGAATPCLRSLLGVGCDEASRVVRFTPRRNQEPPRLIPRRWKKAA